MRGWRLPCGCRCDDAAWLEMCPAHFAETADTHERWKAEHLARNPDVTPVGNGVPTADLFSQEVSRA